MPLGWICLGRKLPNSVNVPVCIVWRGACVEGPGANSALQEARNTSDDRQVIGSDSILVAEEMTFDNHFQVAVSSLTPSLGLLGTKRQVTSDG